MKEIFAIIFFAGLFIIKANAQIRRTTDSTQNVASNSGKKTQRIETTNSLNLNNEQMRQIKEFRLSMKQKKDSINDDQTLTEEQKQTKLKELRKMQREKLNSILTPDQMEKLKAERMKTMKRPGTTNQSDSARSILDN